MNVGARGIRSPETRVRQATGIRKQQIADAALRIIAVQGLRRFTARAIGSEVGISDAAVFRHLPSKQAIVGAAIDRVEELLFEDCPATDDDPVARLGSFFRHRASCIAGNPGVARLLFSEDLAFAGGEEGAGRVAAFKKRSARFVETCLREAKARNRLEPGADVESAALIVMGSLMALVFRNYRNGERLRAAAARLWCVLERMLRPGQRTVLPAANQKPRPPRRANLSNRSGKHE